MAGLWGCRKVRKNLDGTKHFAAFDLPILVDPFTGACEMLEKTPVWGFAMWKGIKKAAREALGF